MQDTKEAQRYLVLKRQQHWISTKNSGVFDNLIQAVHTLMNWFKADVTERDVKVIQYIESLNQPTELVEAIRVVCQTQGITLTLGTKQFDVVFSCKEPENNPILIVAVATVHPHEKGGVGMPVDEQFTVLILLYQAEPHLCLPFSNTHMNIHLGNMIRNKNYKASGTFAKYMKNNVNHKLVPIQGGRPGTSKVERQLQFKSYYTTDQSAAATA